MKDLEQVLEELLRKENAGFLIPKRRLQQLFGGRLALTWIGLILIGIWVVSESVGGNLLLMILIAIVSLITTCFLIAIYLIVVRGQRQFGKRPRPEDVRSIGTFLLLGFPIILSGSILIYLQSFVALAILLGTSVIAILLTLLINESIPQIVSIVSLLRIIPRAFDALGRIFPVLLLLVIFSVFSRDYWQIALQLTPTSMVVVGFIILLPPVFAFLISLREKITELLPKELTWNMVLEILDQHPFVNKKLREGFVSPESWKMLTIQSEWRHLNRALQQCQSDVRRTAIWSFIAVSLFMSIFLLIIASSYFCLLFTFLLPMSFLNITNPNSQAISLFNLILVPQNFPFQEILKVSILTAIFLVAALNASSFTDENYQRIVFAPVVVQARTWLAARIAYDVTKSLDYQFWDKFSNGRLINASLVVPRGLTDTQIKEACLAYEKTLNPVWRVIIIHAFEQSDDPSTFRLSAPGRKWRLIWNKLKTPTEITSFEPIHSDEDSELRYQHSLGFVDGYKQFPNELPNGWFGNETKASELGIKIWDIDEEYVILHPYVFHSEKLVAIELSFARRLPNSISYQQLIKMVFNATLDAFPVDPSAPLNIIVEATYRGYYEKGSNLASLTWYISSDMLEYKDEHLKRPKVESYLRWLNR